MTDNWTSDSKSSCKKTNKNNYQLFFRNLIFELADKICETNSSIPNQTLGWQNMKVSDIRKPLQDHGLCNKGTKVVLDPYIPHPTPGLEGTMIVSNIGQALEDHGLCDKGTKKVVLDSYIPNPIHGLEDMKVSDIRKALQDRGLCDKGTRKVLLTRLKKAVEEEQGEEEMLLREDTKEKTPIDSKSPNIDCHEDKMP